MSKIRICHVSCVHFTYDVRIFQKECKSLVREGYDVHLVISGKNEKKDGVIIHGIGEIPKGRMQRMLFHTRRAFREACKVDADIYHFHDPELLPYALKMKRRGKKVIFDSHENVLDIFADKRYIWKPIRSILEPAYRYYMGECLKKMDLVITVDAMIKEKIQKYNQDVVLVSNYPEIKMDRGDIQNPLGQEHGAYICFAGGITPQWNHEIVMKAAYRAGVKYVMCGKGSEEYIKLLKQCREWENVVYCGMVSHEEVICLLEDAIAGVAVLDYSNNTNWKRGTLGNTKLFEIMVSGIPVICTAFSSWEKIISDYDCGICLEPKDEDALTEAICYMIENRGEAKEMGVRGCTAVKSHYNWNVEERKLLDAYRKLEEK